MTPEPELFPGFNIRLETAVHAAVTNALADIDVVNLQRCQQQLVEATQQVAHFKAQAEVWQELATRRKGDVQALQEQVAELNTRVMFLESVIKNLKAAADE
jgi:predicted CoA-binding protein